MRTIPAAENRGANLRLARKGTKEESAGSSARSDHCKKLGVEGIKWAIKGELNPEMKLSQSIELFVTKRMPPIRSLSDVWF